MSSYPETLPDTFSITAHPWLTYQGMSSRAGHPCRSTIHWHASLSHGTDGRDTTHYEPPEDTPAPRNVHPGYCLSIPAGTGSYIYTTKYL